jgi:hypothetical protein
MKRKIGTLIEEDVIRLAKRRAADEGRPLSDLIQDALVSYLSAGIPDPRKREAAYEVFCERPMRISRDQLREILEEDMWEL